MAIAVVLVGARGVSGTSSVSTTAGTTVASGSTFALCISWDASATVTAPVTDSKGNVYTAQGTPQADSQGGLLQWFVSANGVGGASHNITIGFSAAAFPTAHLLEITGAAASPVDAIAQGQDLATPYTLTSPTLAQANEVVLAAIAPNVGAGAANLVASSNFTVLSQEGDATQYWLSAVASLVVSSTAAVTPSFTSNTGTGGALALVTFKEFTAAAAIYEVPVANRNRPGRGPHSTGRYFRPIGETVITAVATSQAPVARRYYELIGHGTNV